MTVSLKRVTALKRIPARGESATRDSWAETMSTRTQRLGLCKHNRASHKTGESHVCVAVGAHDVDSWGDDIGLHSAIKGWAERGEASKVVWSVVAATW